VLGKQQMMRLSRRDGLVLVYYFCKHWSDGQPSDTGFRQLHAHSRDAFLEAVGSR
jgi:hypothetical protein